MPVHCSHQTSDRGLLSIMVAFWCSATAITAAAAPGPEPQLDSAWKPQLMRNLGPSLAQAESPDDANEPTSRRSPAAGDDEQAKHAKPSRNRSARQGDPDHDPLHIRAQQLLAAEGATNTAYSKLADKYPQHSIVICQAGCRHKTPEIVYFEPRKIQVAEMIPAAATAGSSGGPTTASDAMTCLAGCYDTPRQYSARGRGETDKLSEQAVERYVHQQGTQPSHGVVVSGRWLTTVTEVERKPRRGREIEATSSGQWMRKIETQRRARIRRAY